MRQQYEEKILNWENKLSNLVLENEKIVVINNSLQKKLEHEKQNYKTLERKFEAHSEEVREQWKNYFDKKLLDLQEREHVEKGLVDN